MRSISLAKFEEGVINEDAAIARKEVIAVSDGAGGGGVFADRWSKYLVEHLSDEPITDYESFDKWIDGIWEPFYNGCEEEAQKMYDVKAAIFAEMPKAEIRNPTKPIIATRYTFTWYEFVITK